MSSKTIKDAKARSAGITERTPAASQRGRERSWPVCSRGFLDIIEGGAKVAAAILASPVLQGAYNRWGATPEEVAAAMPGDELVPAPKITSTRAMTIDASPDEVWAWLVQIGQGRGGFYSYDALENLIRCDIHSADQIVPELQDLRPGDLILLAPAEAPCFRVAKAEPPRVLVLVGADPETRAVRPIPATPGEMASTWQWLLHPVDSGRGTRMVARQRYGYPRRQSVMWHLVAAVSLVMERRMLHGIKARAEGHHTAPPAQHRMVHRWSLIGRSRSAAGVRPEAPSHGRS